ncbi:hypothetical protein AVEN_49164-1 [Araneus ventricosus]|uniref:Uncharacterized protein n=1 Tax=Araneus ventricosus TaxID=182803 RepID=A0A4Y2C2U5_ARAVE|nr:hypothetical protein AVEN_49164-1 [Araneus ventricosus]
MNEKMTSLRKYFVLFKNGRVNKEYSEPRAQRAERLQNLLLLGARENKASIESFESRVFARATFQSSNEWNMFVWARIRVSFGGDVTRKRPWTLPSPRMTLELRG